MSQPIACPACGGLNAPDAVFCSNNVCHKALGPFRYIAEEQAARSHWYERLADRVTAFVGTPHFLAIHAVWFVIWIVLNQAGIVDFDSYPFDLLAIILAIEAIFITGLLLVGSSRQTRRAELLGELDYEVSVKTYQRLEALDEALRGLHKRLERLEYLNRERRDRV